MVSTSCISIYTYFGLCTRKWKNSALVESLVQSHNFRITHFFFKKPKCVQRGNRCTMIYHYQMKFIILDHCVRTYKEELCLSDLPSCRRPVHRAAAVRGQDAPACFSLLLVFSWSFLGHSSSSAQRLQGSFVILLSWYPLPPARTNMALPKEPL